MRVAVAGAASAFTSPTIDSVAITDETCVAIKSDRELIRAISPRNDRSAFELICDLFPPAQQPRIRRAPTCDRATARENRARRLSARTKLRDRLHELDSIVGTVSSTKATRARIFEAHARE